MGTVRISVLSLLGIVPLLLPSSLPARQPAKGAKPRPPQDAVVAKDTVSRLDVAYGKDAKQRLDVYSPRGVKRGPIVIFVHGGEWTKGDKAAVSFKPRFLNENGVVFVSVNYRLSPAAKHPAHVNDLAAAIRWVRDHAEEIHGDANKIVLMGHSAGCHLATLAALDPRPLATAGLKPGVLRGVVAWSGGAYDLVEKVAAGGTYPAYIKSAFGEAEGDWKAGSPMTYTRNAKGRPRFLFVSLERGNASHKAAERMVWGIVAAGGKAESVLLTGRSHFEANHLLGSTGDTTGKVLLDFVRRVTKD